MRELIRLKPFAAKRGTTTKVWMDVVAGVSSAIKVTLNVKQVRDRLNVLKAGFRADEAVSALASGVEESLNAVNVQSHHDERSGLVREYLSLASMHKDKKQQQKDGKQKREEDLTRCAEEIVRESTRRRAMRGQEEASYTSSDSENSDAGSTTSSLLTNVSALTSTSETRSATRMPPKRSNAFTREIERQEKRQKLQFDLQVREQEQTHSHFEQRLAFERQQAEDRLLFEERTQASNRELILARAKLFSDALLNRKK